MNDNVTWLEPATETVESSNEKPGSTTEYDPESSPESAPESARESGTTSQASSQPSAQQEAVMNETVNETGSTSSARPPVRHGQIILGVSALVVAVTMLLHLTTSVFAHPLAVPVLVLGLGVFVLVYGLVALRAGRPLSPGEEERREHRALTRITKQEQRRARRAARRS